MTTDDVAGLSSEIGWGDSNEAEPWSTASSALLVAAAGMYWAAIWATSGLSPLSYLASCRPHIGRLGPPSSRP